MDYNCHDITDTFWHNPQYKITLEHPDEGDNHCTIIVALMQKVKRCKKFADVNLLNIGFNIYQVSGFLLRLLNERLI